MNNIDAKNLLSSYLTMEEEDYSIKTGVANDYLSAKKVKDLNKTLLEKPYEGPVSSQNKLFITLDEHGNPKCSFTGFEHKNKYVPMNYLTKKAYEETLKKSNTIDKVFLTPRQGGFVNLSTLEDLEKKKMKKPSSTRAPRSKSKTTVKSKSRSKSRGHKKQEDMNKAKAGGIIADNIQKLDPDNVQVLTNILASLTSK